MKDRRASVHQAFRAALPASLPVLTGYLVLGLAYGILMSSKGIHPIWSLLFGIVCYCGSMQFAAIPYLMAPFQPLHVLLLSIMVNARHLFYGLSMLNKYSGTGKIKNFLIYYMSDETFAITSSANVPEGIEKKDFYFAVTLLDVTYWFTASFIGGILGSILPINSAGLDFALTALFAVLFVEQLTTRTKTICGVIGIVATILALLLFGVDNLVIPAMLFILATLILGRKQLCN